MHRCFAFADPAQDPLTQRRPLLQPVSRIATILLRASKATATHKDIAEQSMAGNLQDFPGYKADGARQRL
jgi:hypothetical protein